MIADIRIGSEYRDSVTKYSDEQLDTLKVPIEVPWEPSAAAKIEAHPGTQFIVLVRNLREMASAADRLSQGMTFDLVLLETGRLALFMKGDKKWEEIANRLGTIGTRGLLLGLLARAIRREADIRPLLPVVNPILMQGVRPKDAEILVQAWKLK